MAMHGIEKLKYRLLGELDDIGASSDGDMSPAKLDYVDKLAHAAKCLCKILDGEEKESYRRSYDGGHGRMYHDGMTDEVSYRRRDSMGRFSRAADEDIMKKLRTIVRETGDEKTRQMVQRLIDDMDAQEK